MIQRKQTVFLLLAAIVGLVCLMLPVGVFRPEGVGVDAVMYNLWILDGNGTASYASAPLFGILLVATLMSLSTIFLYNNRKLQIKMCGFDILLHLIWYAAYAAEAYVNAGALNSTFGFRYAAVFPLVAVILIVMARNGVKADEALVRAADRIR